MKPRRSDRLGERQNKFADFTTSICGFFNIENELFYVYNVFLLTFLSLYFDNLCMDRILKFVPANRKTLAIERHIMYCNDISKSEFKEQEVSNESY